jgi:hypothetical protein
MSIRCVLTIKDRHPECNKALTQKPHQQGHVQQLDAMNIKCPEKGHTSACERQEGQNIYVHIKAPGNKKITPVDSLTPGISRSLWLTLALLVYICPTLIQNTSLFL